MIFGRSIISWIVLALLAICVFILAAWLIPLLFGLVGFAIPARIANVLAFLIALGLFWGGFGYRGAAPS